MFQFFTHVELSRSMAAILEMPQYVIYQKNVAYAFITLSAKSHSFNILRTKKMFLAALLMHASKAILNLPTSSLHLCSPFQQNRKVKIHHQFTSFPKQLGQDSPPQK